MAIKEIVINDDRQFKVQFEQVSTKGVLGFKVEATDDDLDACKEKATNLLQFALKRASLYKDEVKI